MNPNIIIIILLLLIPLYYGIRRLIAFLQTRKKREIVRQLLNFEANKQLQNHISKNLRKISQIISPKYFANIFYKQTLHISKYKKYISLKHIVGIKSQQMESNYFFNLAKKNMAQNLLMISNIPKKYFNNFILPEFLPFGLTYSQQNKKETTNIQNIKCIIFHNPCNFPSQFLFHDCIICSIKGNHLIHWLHPNMAGEMDPYTTFPYFRKSVGDMEDFKTTELRESDFIYVPNGYIFELECKETAAMQCIIMIQFDTMPKIDNEILIMKMEQIQMRKIPTAFYPKKLEKDEIKLLWRNGTINGQKWEKNNIIKNKIASITTA